jgi:serine/threonine-protein kinase HipA
VLSPAYDINPSVDKGGLALNIDSHNNELDFELAKSVGAYFQLSETEMDSILNEVKSVVGTWKSEALKLGISKAEIDLMEGAFRYK